VLGIAGVLRGTRAGPMARPAFRLLITGVFASSVGDLCYAVALPWLILSGVGGSALLGAVLAVYGIARVAGIFAGGVLTDRLGPRPVMLAADLVRCAAVCALGVQTLSGKPIVAVLLAISAVQGLCGGLFQPAALARVPDLLPERELATGNAIDSAVAQFGSLLGPAIGGVLVSAVGAGAAILVDGASFAVSAFTLIAIGWVQRADRHAESAAGRAAGTGGEAGSDAPAQETPPPVTFGQVLRSGRLLHVLFAASLIGNFVYVGSYDVALPTLAHRAYGADGYGALLAVVACGLLIGALLAHRIRSVTRPGMAVAGLTAAMAVSISLVPYLGGLPGALAAMLVFGIGTGGSGVYFVTMLQTWSPRALIGRIMSTIMLASLGTYPVSVALCGYGVKHIGVTAFFPASGLLMACAALLAFSQPSVRNYRSGDRYLSPATRDHAATGV
jgi:predicted MFS family arabinose efflux permease